MAAFKNRAPLPTSRIRSSLNQKITASKRPYYDTDPIIRVVSDSDASLAGEDCNDDTDDDLQVGQIIYPVHRNSL